MGRAEAEALGMPGLPTPIIPHPMGGRPADEVRAIADEYLAAIVHVLLTPREALDREFRGFYPDQRTMFKAKPLFT